MGHFSKIAAFMLAIFCLAVSMEVGTARAAEVGLAGIFGSKALLVIDGAPPRSMAVGQEYGGVKLLSVTESGAQVEMNGRRVALRVGQNAKGEAELREGGETVTLISDGSGHFRTSGMINGRSVTFLVDTGASVIGLGMSEARRLGIRLENAQTVGVSTANGVTQALKVTLDTVKVGGITLRNVEAAVGPDMPVTLLGMSFLNRTNMLREGDKLILKRRF
ncbi:MAG: TIGR02281 family clan AA aspartic protease [Zoogloeaceae bacterium]|jgi:aspartyl protease family protein|nr:TIGR02281 family clan AA aspartic protease [Zoogloeaceae bacterium]